MRACACVCEFACVCVRMRVCVCACACVDECVVVGPGLCVNMGVRVGMKELSFWGETSGVGCAFGF